MRNIDFFEIYKRLDINYTNKQVNSCSSINLKKDTIHQEVISKENQPPESGGYKHRENDGIYLDINFNSNSIALQPCIAIKEKSFRLPIFELTYDFQMPNTTYQVKQNSRLYEEIYSLVYANYSNIIINEITPSRKIKISETKPIFEISEKEGNPYSIFWDDEDIKSNSSILLGEFTGLLYNNEKKYYNKYSFKLPNVSNEELNVILDASHYCNEFAFLKHCRLPFPFDDQRIRPNTQLQWLFIDKWPHLVVLTIPGIEIKQGDELVVDFGNNYHMYYVNNLKTIFKNIIKIKAENTQIFQICTVCRLELEKSIIECKKCIICREYIHDKCGYYYKNSGNSVCCITCLKKSFNIIFGINKKFDYPFSGTSNLSKDSIISILKIYDGDACEECLSLFRKKDLELERCKSAFFCKLLHEFYQIDKHPDNVDSFYAEYNSKNETEPKSSINIDIKALENIYYIFERLVKYLKDFNDENSLCERLKFESYFSQDNYVGHSNHQSKCLFPDSLIYETWGKSKWKDFIFWDKTKNSWVGLLRPNGIFSRFDCCNKYPTIIESFYETEKWVEQRISETTIPKNLISTILTNSDKGPNCNEKDYSKSQDDIVSHTYYHSPYLPTDLASHPDFKIFNNENENKYQGNLPPVNETNNLFSMNDNQLLLNGKLKNANATHSVESELFSFSNSPEFLLNDIRPRVSTTGYIQCCSPVNRKRRIRSTLPLTSNAAKCPTEWRVRGITWHAERKAFIVPYRRDKDGGLTSTTFGAMKYGSPLTAFLKALEFRENYLKEQATKLPEEIKQPSVICDQALLIRNLPNIIWDSNKLVWRALADEELLCNNNLTQKLTFYTQDIEINAMPYGARIAYEIAEVCYIRRKALLLNSKVNTIQNSSVSRLRNKSNSLEGHGDEYQLILEDQNHLLLPKNSQIDITNSQSSCFKQIRLKIIFPNGEEVIRSDLIAWHFRSNSWIITNMIDGSTSNQTKNISFLNYSDSNIKQKSLIQSLIYAIECCTSIPPKCQVYVHAEEAESIIDSEDLAELLKPFPTGISWYCKKRRFYTSNGLDSNGRGQHFSIALYGSLISAFNAAIDYRNIFLKNRRKAILPKVEWILCFPVNQCSINTGSNERINDSDIINNGDIVKELDSCNIYHLSDNYMGSCNDRNIDRINNQISSLNTCISGDSYHSGSDWLQHPTTVSLLDDQIIEPQNDLDNRIMNIELIE
ncbi:unnamed protein product [Cryptosporidium hominis]|uniref:Uncharacterized protein n=1 Tax=Cryptosporidium hominis TaxID=237895 RepID=A0A0S4TEB2_CRYHO|nr:hypothetical protein ChTU502y2012_401g0195 [Cryptosporidium hominis]PPA65165.1 hypothetical protein ChUKH1_15765 [Cryptosporidium hominis]PPS93801.1 Uncharacterized protein GY17_00002524 [Cryptosporidium hominis]CUV05226.1 unnamed protein product [Cryptosporidium hominis]|eukprot:PPS93801.1 Uncharacterized protein GY17_00002524 [Cryptosporidium hominis]